MTQMMFHVLLLSICLLCSCVANRFPQDGIDGDTYIRSLFFFVPLEALYWFGVWIIWCFS